MRWALVCAALVALPGCYLSHRIAEEGETDAGPCEMPPREAVTLRIEIISASPASCARAGHIFELDADLGGGPVFAGCPDSRATPTADGCGLEIEGECLGVEFLRRFSGELRGPRAEGRIDTFMRVGYASAECDRDERWSIAP